ncbi:class I SAM-dependent methyltransferase [Streptomyces sp. AC495_CC817]|uniref:class I SAM-dependent methyltransferase n=1 Tax=Streptomyces sp. AC495_CC817 TaxID=2823900 RepID=UPI001C271DB8|nr:methyltransferase domain-containing protein [Streptomyces sp. AC495_CC817]
MSERIERIRRAFDRRAADYDESLMHRSLAEAVADSLGLGGVEAVLDVATGTGLVLRSVAPRATGVRLVGVDISPAMLAVAARELPSAEWIEADAAQVPLPDGSVELVTCVTALHILPDVPAAASEWKRVLRAGGRLVTATFETAHPLPAASPEDEHPYPRDHAPYASPDRISAVFAPYGFRLRGHTRWSDDTDAVLIAEFVAESSA